VQRAAEEGSSTLYFSIKSADGLIIDLRYDPVRGRLIGDSTEFVVDDGTGRATTVSEIDFSSPSIAEGCQTVRRWIDEGQIRLRARDRFGGVKLTYKGREYLLDIKFDARMQERPIEVIPKKPFVGGNRTDDRVREVALRFFRDGNFHGTWDHEAIGYHVHGGVRTRDESGRVTPQYLINLLKHWYRVESDFYEAIPAAAQREAWLFQPDPAFKQRVIAGLLDRQQIDGRLESTGEWIIRIAREMDSYTPTRFADMNADNHLWALLKEAEREGHVRIGPVAGGRADQLSISVADAPDSATAGVGEYQPFVWSRTQRIPIPTVELRTPDVIHKGRRIDSRGLGDLFDFWMWYSHGASEGYANMEQVFPPFVPPVRPG
jgi:hypothetical protein